MTTSAPDDGPVTFINVIEIPEGEIDTFIANWQDRSRLMTTADGFISAELHQAVTADTEFKVINVTKWQSRALFDAAINAPGYRAQLTRYQSSDEASWTPHRGFYRTAASFD